MTFSLDDVAFLRSAAGEALLARLAAEDVSEVNTLPLLTRLRRDYAPQSARAALLMAQLRLRAMAKFGEDARKLFFTPSAIEQASHPAVAAYRAGRIGAHVVLDVCCGIGGDALALARVGAQVRGIDWSEVRVAMANYNAEVLGLPAQFMVRDARDPLPAPYDALFFDPSRRDEDGRRRHHVEAYQPPLSIIQRWDAPMIAVKLSPGVDLSQVADYGGGVEFVSVADDLKEAILWLGAGWQGRRATLLQGGRVWSLAREAEPHIAIAEPQAWLAEPNAALIRAGLVADVAAVLGGALLDETIAYFTTAQRPQSPWVRAWRLRDWMPFNLKALKAYLRQRGIGRVTVKKRGSPITPEALIAQLKPKGDDAAVVVLTRLRGRPIVLICDEMSQNLLE